jgi:hypothetical protein
VQVAKHLPPLDIDEDSAAQGSGAQAATPSLADASEASGDGSKAILPHAASASTPATSLPDIAAIISLAALAHERPLDRTGTARRSARWHCSTWKIGRAENDSTRRRDDDVDNRSDVFGMTSMIAGVRRRTAQAVRRGSTYGCHSQETA